MNKLMMQVHYIKNVIECYCNFGSEFYLQDRMNNNLDNNNYNEAFKQIVNFI